MPGSEMAPGAYGWIALCIFLMGLSKGGFPVGPIALPAMILLWPDQTQAAKTAVSFMLPMLCAMDIVAMAFYWKQIEWRRLGKLFPSTLLGVAIGSVMFATGGDTFAKLTETALKLMIGVIGLLFVVYQVARSRILSQLKDRPPGWGKSSVFGLTAGITSTLAHAAGPVIQMYLLPQRLPKLRFVGTSVAFFFVLNLVKVLPFAMLGRLEKQNLVMGLKLLPIIPVGVATGYGLVRLIKGHHYRWFIYAILLVTSLTLISKTLFG